LATLYYSICLRLFSKKFLKNFFCKIFHRNRPSSPNPSPLVWGRGCLCSAVHRPLVRGGGQAHRRRRRRDSRRHRLDRSGHECLSRAGRLRQAGEQPVVHDPEGRIGVLHTIPQGGVGLAVAVQGFRNSLDQCSQSRLTGRPQPGQERGSESLDRHADRRSVFLVGTLLDRAGDPQRDGFIEPHRAGGQGGHGLESLADHGLDGGHDNLIHRFVSGVASREVRPAILLELFRTIVFQIVPRLGRAFRPAPGFTLPGGGEPDPCCPAAAPAA